MRVCFTELLQGLESPLSLSVAERAEDKHIDFLADRRCQKTRAVQFRTDDLQIGIAFESVGQQMRMKRRIVGNEHTNCPSMLVMVVLHRYPPTDSQMIWPRVGSVLKIR